MPSRLNLLLAIAAPLLALGCYPDLKDRGCASEEDCFEGELCRSGLCRTVTVVNVNNTNNADADAGGNNADEGATLVVRALHHDTEEPLPRALISVGGASSLCNCQPEDSPAAACAFEGLTPGLDYTLCASLNGFQSCQALVQTAAPGDTAVDLWLSPCPAEQPDCGTPTGCACNGLPACTPPGG